MKKQIFTFCFITSCFLSLNAQSLLDDFENGISFTDKISTHIASDASCSVDENPNPDDVNNSEAVLMFLRKSDQNFWMGAYANLTESNKLLSRNHSRLQLKYFRTTEKSTIRIKINGDDSVGEFDPVTPPSKVNEWGPGPKKHVPKEMKYAYEPQIDEMKYDYDIKPIDDFDI